MFNFLKRSFLLVAFFGLIPASFSSENPEVYPKLAIQQDFAQLYKELEQSHANLYFNFSKDDYTKAYNEIYAQIDESMTKTDIQLLFQKFMALGNIAHSRIDLPMDAFFEYRANGGTMIPLFIDIKNNKVFIDSVYSEQKSLTSGMQITAIDGVDIQKWLMQFSAYISADSRDLAHTIIESQFPFLLYLLLGEKPTFTVDVLVNGKNTQHILLALSKTQQSELSANTIADTEVTELRQAKMLAHNIAYLRPGPFYNAESTSGNTWDNSAFISFIDKSFEDFNNQNATALLIDLRNNPGGTNSFSDHMIAWFADKPFKFASSFLVKVSKYAKQAHQERLDANPNPDEISLQLQAFYEQHEIGDVFDFNLPLTAPHKEKRFNKPVYILIDETSFSNAVSVAAITKDYGFATILGEATTDFATTHASMESFFLNNTGIKVGFPKALIVRPNGDKTPGIVKPDYVITGTPNEQLEESVAFIHKR